MKLKSLFLMAAMALSITTLAGCGGQEEEKPKENNTAQSNTTQNQTPVKKEELNVSKILNTLKASVSTVTEILVYTEDTDPNNTLGKANSYIDAGAFVDSRVPKNEFSDDRIVTDRGGSIEKFANETDAKARDTLLAGFDGTAMASYHKQVGVYVIRASNQLKASEQKELSDAIEKIIKG